MTNAKKVYVVTGATGNIGKPLVAQLRASGATVRAIGRDRATLAAHGAEAHVGSLEDVAFLTETFRGATAVFAMIPPNYGAADQRKYQNDVGRALAKAIAASRVTHVVSLSSIGAHLDRDTGPILGLHDQEQRLAQLGDVNVLSLRPAYFMENLLHQVPLIQSQGIVGSPLRGDLRFAMIATRDIAEAAARHMLALDFHGKAVEELHGERDVSMEEVTQIVATALGRPHLPYVTFPYEAAEQAMVAAGMSVDAARKMNEMNRSMNEGRLKGAVPRSPRTTTATPIERFALELPRKAAA